LKILQNNSEKFQKIMKNLMENSVWNWNRSNRTIRKVKSGSTLVSGSRSRSGLTLRLRI